MIRDTSETELALNSRRNRLWSSCSICLIRLLTTPCVTTHCTQMLQAHLCPLFL